MDNKQALYLYCIVALGDGLVQGVKGIDDAPVFYVVRQDIALACSYLPGLVFEATQDNIFRHEEVVETMMAQACVLPIRLGTVMDKYEHAEAFLKLRYGWLKHNLERLAGKVEYTVRAVAVNKDAFEALQPSSGQYPAANAQDYLLQRRRSETARRSKEQKIAYLFSGMEQELLQEAVAVSKKTSVDGFLFNAAYLVDKKQSAAFEQRCRTVEQNYPTLKFLITGPWPTYSFIEPYEDYVHKNGGPSGGQKGS